MDKELINRVKNLSIEYHDNNPSSIWLALGFRDCKNEVLKIIDEISDGEEASKNFHEDRNWEKLSKEWIEEHTTCYWDNEDDDGDVKYVEVSDLQNLLIPTNDTDKGATTMQGKVTIPRFVADWIEDNKAKGNSMCHLMTYETIKLHCPHEMCLWLFEGSGNNENIEKMARAWLDGYVVEQEQLYTVTMKDNSKLVRMNSGFIRFVFDHEIVDVDYNLTQAEIESVDPILMGIAKEVE